MAEDDLDDEAEIQKLIKEEDINMLPEAYDLAEIDKLTGIPKLKGKIKLILTLNRLTPFCNSYASPIHYDQYFQV